MVFRNKTKNKKFNKTKNKKFNKTKKKLNKKKKKKLIQNIKMKGGNPLDDNVNTYFKSYNLIDFKIGKKYLLEDANTLNDYCKNKLIYPLDDCAIISNDYISPNTELIDDNCCNWKNIKTTSKESVKTFMLGSIINIDDKRLKFIKEFLPINTTQEGKKILYLQYIKNNIIQLLQNIEIEKLNNLISKIKEDMDDEDEFNVDMNISKEAKIEIINDYIFQDDFYYLEDILLFLNPIYKTNEEYIKNKRNYKSYLDAKDIRIQDIQNNPNKLFEEILENNKKVMHLYFSYGNLKHINIVDWDFVLNIYVEELVKYINDPDIENIVIAGHSVGSIIIQKLGILLLKYRINIEKIQIICSGCRVSNVLHPDELQLFKINYTNNIFVVAGYINDGIIYFDYNPHMFPSFAHSEELNPVTTHLLICQNNETNIQNCASVIYNTVSNFNQPKIGDSLSSIHDFINYKTLYLKTL
jgi:hypothetical protein